jgi:hypothetical protein
MTKHKESLRALEELLGKIQTDLNRARMLVHQILEWKESTQQLWWVHSTFDAIVGDLVPKSAPENNEIQVIEWVFDGYFMFGSDKKKYPVPLNYSSKTKLIPGDVLKLRIMEDGKLMYKLIAQAPRTYIKATLSKTDDNKFTAISDNGSIYYLNQAAVTYFKGQTGDEIAIIINADNIGDSAAIEALIPRSWWLTTMMQQAENMITNNETPPSTKPIKEKASITEKEASTTPKTTSKNTPKTTTKVTTKTKKKPTKDL